MTAAETQLRGDICLAWCKPEHSHQIAREDPIHPADQGVYHQRVIDTWMASNADHHDKPIVVMIEGFRHDASQDGADSQDWPDMVWATGGVNPGCMGDVCLPPRDARRLATALHTAADIAGGLA